MLPQRGARFDVLLRRARWRLGGRAGDGCQFVSWIHDADLVRAMYWLIDHPLEGPVTPAPPEPTSFEEFMGALRKAWGVRLGLPATHWMLEVATFLLRTESEL